MPASTDSRRSQIQYAALAQNLVLTTAMLLLVCPRSASALHCSRRGGNRVCEILEDVPMPRIEFADERDKNFSSPSKRLMQGEKNPNAENQGTTEAKQGGSRFEATIVGNPTAEQRNAVAFCMDRVAENWVSSVPVLVHVSFEELGVPSLLGVAQPSRNWVVRDYICPVALAEAILGEDLNADASGKLRYDIWMRLNSAAQWYAGTDARPPRGRYDLVTVCLHEIYHGLFMSGGNIGVSIDANGTYEGVFYHARYRGRFDAFMANQDGCQISGYTETDKLGRVLTGNNLWFAMGNDRIARLHSPRPYTAGSSLYHLSEWEYGQDTSGNDLMTPAIGSNYAQHNVGPVVTRMTEAVTNVGTWSGAEICATLRDPEDGGGTIDQGGLGGDGDRNSNGSPAGGFRVRIGDSSFSGWILVGAGLGALAGGVFAGLVARSTIAERRRKAGAAAKSDDGRRRRALERIDFDKAGNGGGVV